MKDNSLSKMELESDLEEGASISLMEATLALRRGDTDNAFAHAALAMGNYGYLENIGGVHRCQEILRKIGLSKKDILETTAESYTAVMTYAKVARGLGLASTEVNEMMKPLDLKGFED